MVLKFGGPEIDPIKRSLVALIVGPKSTKSDSTTHVLRAACAVVAFEAFKHAWIIDASLRHVIHNEGHLLERHVVFILVMTMIDQLQTEIEFG